MSIEAGRMYNALKLHFNSEDYDYIKYKGKTRIKFIPEPQVYTFQKLNNRYKEELQNFYISNLLENPNVWIFDLLNQECDDTYKSWKRTQESLSYIFKNDISNILDSNENFNDIFQVKKTFPPLMIFVQQKRIKLETLLILDDILKFLGKWDKRINDEFIWKSFKLKCLKYKPFLSFDKDKMKSILKEEVKRMV